MKKLLNVLYITNPEAYLSKDGENIVIKVENKEKMRLPIHTLESIVCFGFLGASPALMALCAERGVGLSFCSPYGKFQARITGKIQGNVLLRQKQYQIAQEEIGSLPIAKNCIKGKLLNCRKVIERGLRDHKQSVRVEHLETISKKLLKAVKHIDDVETLDHLRGVEGDAAKEYFSCFGDLIVNQKEDFFLNGRNRRPPLDNTNALLSFVYSMLANDVQSALETVGLDPYMGFLHRVRPGRASLALDLMEELRPVWADRFVLSLINRKQITAKDFDKKENGAILMKEKSRKDLLQAIHNRKREEFMHPFLKEKISYGLLPYVQALLLARHLRGDLDEYPPFLWV